METGRIIHGRFFVGEQSRLRCLRLPAAGVCLGAFAGDAVTVQRGLGKQVESCGRKTEFVLRGRQAAFVAFHGVGESSGFVVGRVMADTASKAGGLPFWSVFAIGGLVIVAAIFVVRGGQHFLGGILGGKKKPAVIQTASEKPVATQERPLARPTQPPRVAEKSKASETNGTPGESQAEELYCTGYIVLPTGPIVCLSDGSEFEGIADGVQSVSRKAVVISGKSYPVRRYKPKPLEPGRAVEVAPAPVPVVSSPPVVTYQEQKPINQAIILPAIHAQGGTPPPRLNGFGSMNRQFSQGRQNEQAHDER